MTIFKNEKLKNLLEISLKEIINDSHDLNKVIFNFSSYQLSDVEKSVLCKGLNFSVKPESIEYSGFLLRFQLLFRDVKQENLHSEDLSLIKARLLDYLTQLCPHMKVFLETKVHLKT